MACCGGRITPDALERAGVAEAAGAVCAEQDIDSARYVFGDPASVCADACPGLLVEVFAAGGGVVDVLGGPVCVQVGCVQQLSRLCDLELERDGISLLVEEGVGD